MSTPGHVEPCRLYLTPLSRVTRPGQVPLEGGKLRQDYRSITVEEALAGLIKVMCNSRFMALIVIVAGFWAIQGQLYATMPKYMLRLVGEGSKPAPAEPPHGGL